MLGYGFMNNQTVIAFLIGSNLLILLGLIYKKSHNVGLLYKQQQLELTLQDLQHTAQRHEHAIDRATQSSSIAEQAHTMGLQNMQLSQVRKLTV